MLRFLGYTPLNEQAQHIHKGGVTTALASPPSLAGLSKAALGEKLVAAGVEPGKAKMRAEQLWRWICHYGVTDFAAMTNVAKDLRGTLAEHYTLARPEIVTGQVSQDGTRKWLTRFGPGTEGECVFIPDVGRSGALCVSSQVGCTLNCTFCHTGTQKLVRNLSAAEIVGQVMIARDALNEWPTQARPLNDGDRQLTNIVFMGMGEPLANFEPTWAAVERLHGDIGIGARHMTISTVGLVPGIRRLAEAELPVNLAVSLHAAHDALRNELVPINRRWGIEELLDACEDYFGKTRRRVSFEWALIDGVNDRFEDADRLAALSQRISAHVNLIPLNPTPGYAVRGSSRNRVHAFARRLGDMGVNATIRDTRGSDIDAACGQLRAGHEATAVGSPRRR